MNIEIEIEKKMMIDMKEQLEEVIEKFGEEIGGIVSLLAQHHFFAVNYEAEKLDEERLGIFHSVTASLLYLIKRECP